MKIGCTEPQNHKKGPRRACAGALPVRKEKKENVIKQKAPPFPRTAAPLLVLEFTPLPPICQAPPPKFSGFTQNAHRPVLLFFHINHSILFFSVLPGSAVFPAAPINSTSDFSSQKLFKICLTLFLHYGMLIKRSNETGTTRCRSGGIGRRPGLKIPWVVIPVPVRPRPAASGKETKT